MTLRELAAAATAQLQTSPHPDRARQDAELLLLHTLHRNRAWLLANWSEDATPEDQDLYAGLITRRASGEPLQYITGEAEFFGLPYSVGPGVLIPRPETEHLVEEVIRLAASYVTPRIADIGTGSGIIAVALATQLAKAHIIAIDLSPQALTIARENAERHQVTSRVTFVEGDLLAPLDGQQFDIIASNPPYIPQSEHDSLSTEVRDHEPHTALFAGHDGLAIYQRLIPAAEKNLSGNGWLVLEIGYDQHPAVQHLLEASGYTGIRFIPDYQGIPRVAVAQRIKS